MSAALKRRFNFVQVPVVENLEQEIAIVRKREAELRGDYLVGKEPTEELARLLVTVFHELRAGQTLDGKTKVKTPNAVLSTAEAISVLFSAGILSEGFGSGPVGADDLARSMLGALAKEGEDDQKAVREYNETVAKGRDGLWKAFHQSIKRQLRP
jgi:hypothetical protein